MAIVRGEGRHGNKQQLIGRLLAFKPKIEKREVREHLYAQYLARCSKMYEESAFSARGDVLKAIKLGGIGSLKPAKMPNPRSASEGARKYTPQSPLQCDIQGGPGPRPQLDIQGCGCLWLQGRRLSRVRRRSIPCLLEDRRQEAGSRNNEEA